MIDLITGRILLIEDDPTLGAFTSEWLGAHGYDVDLQISGRDALKALGQKQYDLLILDLNLPDMDGFQVCQRIRAMGFTGEILMLTARSSEIDQVMGLEVGADDYLTKPVAPGLLLARVRAQIRRLNRRQQPNQIVNGPFLLCLSTRAVLFDGKSLDVTTREFELLKLLASRAGEPVSRDELYERVQGHGFDGIARSVDILVSRLRKRFESLRPDYPLFKTIRGVGYMMVKLS